MGKSSQYTHKMQRIDVPGENNNVINIEEYFDGLRYLKMEGIDDIGKPKNIYTEEYADSDRKRVYFPPDGNYTNDGTVITLTVIIIGDRGKRSSTFDEFVDYIRHGVHRYWDNARNKEFDFVVTDEIKVSEEKWHGSQPYIEVKIPLQNLNGITRIHTDS